MTNTTTGAEQVWSARYNQMIPAEWADKELTWNGHQWFLFDDTAGPQGPPEQPEQPDEPDEPERYDPADYNVDEVNAHLETVDARERSRILRAERRNKARKGILGDE